MHAMHIDLEESWIAFPVKIYNFYRVFDIFKLLL